MAHNNKNLILVTFERTYSWIYPDEVSQKSFYYRKTTFNRLVVDCAQSMCWKSSPIDCVEDDYESFSLEDKNAPISYHRDSKVVTYRIFRVVGNEIIPFNIKGLKSLAFKKKQELDSKRKPYKIFENTYSFRRDPVPYTGKYCYVWGRHGFGHRHPIMKRVVILNTDPEYKEFNDSEYRRVRDGWYDSKMGRLGSKSWKDNHKCRKQYMKHW